MDRLQVTQIQGTGCTGVNVGRLTTSGATIASITNSTIQSASASGVTRAGNGMYIFDAGGLYLSQNDIILSQNGTVISPGAGQEVIWLFANNTVLGDTVTGAPLTISTASPSGTVRGLYFQGTWTATSSSSNGVTIENVGGGKVEGVYFNGQSRF